MASKAGGDHIVLGRTPVKGVIRDLPVYAITEDALYDSLNVIVREGVLRPRAGLSQFVPDDLLDRPMGLFNTTTTAAGFVQEDAFQLDAFQSGASTTTSTLLAGTTKRIWAFFSGKWNDITNTVLGGTGRAHVRMTAIEIAGVVHTIIVNGLDTPRKWNGSDATVSNVGGSPAPPTWFDVATAADRIIGLVSPYKVQWGEPLDITTGWTAANVRSLADTTDPLRAIRPLGTLGVAVYKSRSIWAGYATGAAGASAFRFEIRRMVDGPTGPSAVVDANGTHFYMTDTGRIGAFDGSAHRWIADDVWTIIRADLDRAEAIRINGHFHPVTGLITFHYPRLGAAGEVKGCVVVVPPDTEGHIPEYIAFPCRLEVSITASGQRWADAQDVLALRADNHRSYVVQEDIRDAELDFSGYWQGGLPPTPNLLPHRVESIEVFAERGTGFGQLTVKPIVTNLLHSPLGTQAGSQTVNLDATNEVYDLKGFDARGRFLGIRHEFTTPITLRWALTRLAARKVE